MNNFENILWDDILSDIKDESCVLFIGTDFFTENGLPVWTNSLKEIYKLYEKQILFFDESNELFVFKSALLKKSIVQRLQQKYQNIENTNVYRQIAQIPFHCVISLSPDLFLHQAVKNYLPDAGFTYFSKSQPIVERTLPTHTEPLFYNLAGILDSEESIVLSHNDLFDYLNAILGEDKLPKYLTETIRNARRLLFLGFRFDKWYMQIILRIFNLHKEKRLNYAVNTNVGKETEKLVGASFQDIEFIPEKGIEFIAELHKQCSSILRTLNEPKDINIQPIADDTKVRKIEFLKKQIGDNYDYLEKVLEQKRLAQTLKEEEYNQKEADKIQAVIDKFELELEKLIR